MVSIEVLEKYFPDLTAEQKEQFRMLQPLYETWNAMINVISRKDIEQLYERHVLHGLAISKIAAFKAGDKVLDVGTGGGFPGIPLAVYYPGTQFTLIDAIAKKIKVVNEVKDALKLQNMEAFQCRAEEVAERFDAVVCRAVTDLTPFFGWIKNKLKSKPAKVYCLKGGDLHDELLMFKLAYPAVDIKEHRLSDWFTEEFFETKKIVELTF